MDGVQELLTGWLIGYRYIFLDVIRHNFIPPGFTVGLHEMRLSVPGWNHPGRHLNDLPRGQCQLLPSPEPAHSQPGRGEDCLET